MVGIVDGAVAVDALFLLSGSKWFFLSGATRLHYFYEIRSVCTRL